jgi:broad specificity phosphatase PhoE
MAALETVRGQHAGKEVVIVCHGAVIQTVCAHITGEWSESFVPPNCGVVEIGWNPDGWLPPVVSDDWEGLGEAAESRISPVNV